jgi:hypothetical protein
MGRAVTLRDIDVLPVLGRGPIGLAIFTPGVQVDPGDNSFSRVNGTRQGANNATLDGIDVNDSVVPRLGLSMTANNLDSVAEFRIITMGGKAEYGRNAGGQVEMITRSGTNEFHGNAFEYLRNKQLNANNFFSNKSGLARPKFIQNIFGGSFGGPVIKDKTFFFGNYQGTRNAQAVERNRTVLTPEAKSGIFRWKNSAGAVLSHSIIQADPRKIGIDREVKKLLDVLPNPNNFDIGDGLNTGGFRFNNPVSAVNDQYTLKGDQNLGRHKLFVRWSWFRTRSIDNLNNADAIYPGQPQGAQGGHRWGYSIGWDTMVTNSIVNEFRTGYQSAGVDFLRPGRIAGPMIVTNLYTSPFNTAFPQGRNSPVSEFTDYLSIVRGEHTLKTGMNWRFTTQLGYNDAGIHPNVSLGTTLGNAPPTSVMPPGLSSTDQARYNSLYNDLLGRMNEVVVTYYSDLQEFQPAGTTRERTNKFREYGYFFQDDWRVSRRLTLNLGLRYEFFGVPFEKNGFQGALDKAALVSPTAKINDFTVQRTTSWYNNDYNNFAPRVGFAWDVAGDGRTAVRGSWGLFYDRIIGATTNLVDGNTPGFADTRRIQPNLSGSDLRVGDGIPTPPQPASPTVKNANDRGTTVVVFSPNLRTPYVHQFNVGVQRELFRNTILEVTYVGNRGKKLFADLNYNQSRIYEDFLPAFLQLQEFQRVGTPVPASNTLVKMFGSVSTAIARVGATNLANGNVGGAANSIDRGYYSSYAAAGLTDYYLRNFPQYNFMIYGGNFAQSWYNSLQVNVRRSVGALQVRANYTFSKSIDNYSTEGNGYTDGVPIDNFNIDLFRARSDWDRPHVFNSSLIYRLPIGRDKAVLGGIPNWADKILGGWDLGFLAYWQSGSTFSVVTGRSTGPTTSTNTYANFDGDRNFGAIDRRGDGIYFWNNQQKGGFTFPGAGYVGASGRNGFRGPRFFSTDVSLSKNFRVTETHRVTFRAEAYNMTNSANFANPAANISTPESVGRISGTIGQPRIVQLALRYDF